MTSNRLLLRAALYALLPACIVVVVLTALPPAPARAQGPIPVQVSAGEPIHPAVFDGDVRNLPRIPSKPLQRRPLVEPRGTKASAVAPESPTTLPAAPNAMPLTTVNFEGLSMTDTCTGGACGAGWPPDPNGDVGPNHYVEAVNTSIGIFDKTGARLAAFTFDSLWSGANTGTYCDNQNQGDPVVVYDQLGDRWIVTDFGFTGSGTTPPFYECIAVSRTGDPVSGGWYLYALRADDAAHPWFNDYPKLGVWRDGLYMSANMFNAAGSFQEVRVWALNRAQLEAGVAPSVVVVDLGTTAYFTLLPSNLRGALPPTGTPNYFVSESGSAFAFLVWKFGVNWTNPAASTFTGPTSVSQASYSVASGNIVPQPGTSTKLDSLGERMMMQAQYRNIAGAESLWVVHTVRTAVNSTTALQWAQISVTGGTIATTPVQQQIYNNGGDALWRWMPSLAVDSGGNMAIGFSTANGTAPNYPSLAYAGRLASDPANTLGQGEASMFAGTASQIVTCGPGACSRWGDYSAMTVDPSDDCTFWYVNEYYGVGDTAHWRTRIGAFKYPSCVASALEPTGIWDGGGADNNWSTAANWTRNTVPGSLDNVYFNATSPKNATIDANYTFTSWTIASTYGGTINQGTGNVTAQTAFAQAGGTFSGGSGTLTVTGAISLSGGTFGAPALLMLTGDFGNNGTFSGNNGTVVFAGAAPQVARGLSTTPFANVVLSSTAGLTLAQNISLTGWLTHTAGVFNPSGRTVAFNGAAPQSIGGALPTTFDVLAAANTAAGVTLGQEITVTTRLTLTGDLTTTGAYTLNLLAGATTAGTGDVWGRTRRTHAFTTGTAYAFGNPNVSVKFTAGTTPTALTFWLSRPVPSSSGFTNAVQRLYDINATGGSGYTAALRLAYRDSELNGNAEGSLQEWHFSGGWTGFAATAFDTVANWVEFSGVNGFSPWVISQNGPAAPTAVSLSTFEAHNAAGADDAPLWEAAVLAVLGLTVTLVVATHRR